MFRLEFNPTTIENNFISLFGNASSIWHLWHTLKIQGVESKVYSVMDNLLLQPETGIRGMISSPLSQTDW